MAEQLEQFHGRLVGMQQQALGSTLTAGAATGATVLTVAETGDFNEDGGFLVTPAGAVYEYVAVDDMASTVTLAGAGLTVAMTAEDAVHLYDDELESEVVEYVGQVLLDDQDPGDEPIEVTVQHSLVNLIAETIRGGAAEAVTLVRDGDDDLMIWQVDGKVVSDVALKETKDSLSLDIQAAYDLADSKATEAYVNATATTISQTAANGKSKVTYSLSGPGTTANNAGDIWFQKEVTTQTIIGQWEGLGGNSWSQKTLNDQVIANLDAGKLVAGSAFTNALWVKTNFTLGDASTNGVIQSYNFAGSSVGVFIDKTGLVAKGGSITGAQLTGINIDATSSITGATYQTSSTAGVGIKFTSSRLVAYGSPGVEMFSLTASTGLLTLYGDFTSWANGYFNGNFGVGGVTDCYARVNVHSGGVDVTGASSFGSIGCSTLTSSSGVTVSSGGITVSGGGVTVSGASTFNAITSTGDVTGSRLFASAPDTAGSGDSDVKMGPSGQIKKVVSASRYKKYIRPAEIDVAAVYALEPVSYEVRAEYRSEDEPAGTREYGVIADQAAELGLEPWVGRNADGEVETFVYSSFTVALLAAARDLNARVAALEGAA